MRTITITVTEAEFRDIQSALFFFSKAQRLVHQYDACSMPPRYRKVAHRFFVLHRRLNNCQ